MTEKQLEQMRINSTRNPMTITSAYKAGALDMREKMIEKACEWLYNNQPAIGDSMRKYIDSFRKAMEE